MSDSCQRPFLLVASWAGSAAAQTSWAGTKLLTTPTSITVRACSSAQPCWSRCQPILARNFRHRHRTLVRCWRKPYELT